MNGLSRSRKQALYGATSIGRSSSRAPASGLNAAEAPRSELSKTGPTDVLGHDFERFTEPANREIMEPIPRERFALMPHDLLIINGTVIDGSGGAGIRADVSVSNGRITGIGELASEEAAEIIDAEGHVVSPGFIDGHTHMDAQVYWDPLGTCSSYHGITSVVMGNCGFTLAPSRADARELAP